MSQFHLWQWAAEYAHGAAAVVLILLVQSTIMIALGLLAARIAAKNSSAAQSATLRAVLLAVLVCPVAGLLLDRIGLIRVRLHLPGALPLWQAPHAVWPIAIGCAMLVGAALAIRLAVALRMVRRIRRGATSAPLGWIEDAGRCARVFRVTAPPVLLTDYFNTPCLVGWAAPAILLPMGAGSLRSEVLVHELAHVRRRDCLWNLFARAATALLWFQPLMWVLARRLEQAADEVCDDFVVAYGSDRADYAHQLVDMAERHQNSWVHSGCALGMAAMKSAVARRVVRIMDDTRRASAVARWATTLMVVTIFTVGAGLATMLQVGDAVAGADVPSAASPRLPVPDGAGVAKAEKLVRDAFGNYPATPLKDRPALAAKMIQGGIETQGNDAGRYVLLKDGMDLASGAGDAADALKAADELTRLYAVNGNDLRLELTRKASLAATTPASAQSVAEIGLKCADDAVAIGDYDTAMKFLAPTETAAHRISPLVASIETRAGEIRWMHQESMHAKVAEEKRAKNADDPEANLAIGRFQCMVRTNWKQGLPDLLKGSNPAFRAAAANDLSNPTHFDKQVAAGDLWWDLADKEQSGAQLALRRRAAYWYTQAVADTTFGGLQRVLTEKRLAQAPPPMAEQAVAETPSSGANAFADTSAKTFTNSVGMKFVRIEPGEFDMGSPANEVGHDMVETLHHVKITKPFMIAATTVTQAQWNAIMGKNSSDFPGDNHPVDKVSWDDAVAFCEKLSAKEGKHYRLPTEAEFEYACRAGTQTAYSFGDGNIDDYAWYGGNSGKKTHEVATKKPNRWGLYDMNGNIWQWCSDGYGHYTGDAVDPRGSDDTSLRVLRGGSWNYGERDCRAAYRSKAPPAFRVNLFGFRVCLDIAQTPGVAAAPAIPASGATNLLSLVDLPKDIVEGVWTRSADGIENPGDRRGARIRLLSNPPAEYDLRMVFTMHGEHASFGVLLAQNDMSGMWKIDFGDSCRFRGAGDTAHMLPEKIARLEPRLTIGEKHEAIIKVRNDSISTFIDGKPMGKITEDYSQCRLEPYWSIGGHAIGLANGDTNVTFHTVELNAVSGASTSPPLIADGIYIWGNGLPVDFHPDGRCFVGPRDAGAWSVDGDTLEIQWGDKDGKHRHTERLQIVDKGAGLLTVAHGKYLRQNSPIASTISNENARELTMALNDPAHWTGDKRGTLQITAGKIRGEGEATVRYDGKIPRDVALSFTINFIEGTRGGLDFYGMDMKLTDQGKAETLWPVDSRTITAVKGSPSARNQPRLVKFKLRAESYEMEVDHQPAFTGTYKPGNEFGMRFLAGDAKDRGIVEVSDFKVESIDSSDLPTANPTSIFSAGATGAKNVLLFVGNGKEETLFKGVGAEVHVVKSKETVKMMVNSQAYAQSDVIVWGRNTLTTPPENLFTDAAWDAMRHFMERGGDLVIFEQSGGNPETGRQMKANWSFIEKTFGIKMGGGAIKGAVIDPALAKGVEAAGLTDDFLAKVVFYNDYQALPDNATVLVRAGGHHNQIVVAGVPVGKGRLILVGTNLDAADEPLDRVIFQYIYAKRSAASGTGGGPKSIFDTNPPRGTSTFSDPPALVVSKDMQDFAVQRNALPADQRIAATLAKLKAVNRGDDIHANIATNADGTLSVDIINQDSIFGIEPLYGLKISRLNLCGCRYLKSLNGVQGMPLTEVKLANCSGLEGDLSALAGMKLTTLEIRGCEKLKSLHGLQGMPLTELDANHCYALEDISALKGMQLTKLDLHQCQNLKTLGGLEGMPLIGELNLGNCYNLEGDLSALVGMHLTKLDLNGCQNIRNLNGIQGMPFTELNLLNGYSLQDISALKGMHLAKISLQHCEKLKGLDGLEGAPLKELELPKQLGKEYAKTVLQIFPTLEVVKTGDAKLDEELAAQIARRTPGNAAESAKPTPANAAPRPPGSSVFTPDTDPAPAAPKAPANAK